MSSTLLPSLYDFCTLDYLYLLDSKNFNIAGSVASYIASIPTALSVYPRDSYTAVVGVSGGGAPTLLGCTL